MSENMQSGKWPETFIITNEKPSAHDRNPAEPFAQPILVNFPHNPDGLLPTPKRKSKKHRLEATETRANYLKLNLIKDRTLNHDVAAYHPITTSLYVDRTLHVDAKLSMQIDGQTFTGTNDLKLESSLVLVEHDLDTDTYSLVQPLCFTSMCPEVLLQEAKLTESHHHTAELDGSGRFGGQHFRSKRRRMVEESMKGRGAQMSTNAVLVVNDKSSTDVSSEKKNAAASGEPEHATSSSTSPVRPKCNEKADKVKNIYPVRGFMPKNIESALAEDAERLMPTVNPSELPALLATVHATVSINPGETRRAALFQLARLLHDLLFASVGRNFKSELLDSNSSVVVRTHIEQTYTTPTIAARIITQQLHKKLLSHLILVLLHLFEFEVSLSKLDAMLPTIDRKGKQAVSLAKYLGCEVSTVLDVVKIDVKKFKLPASSAVRSPFAGLSRRK